VEDLAGTLLLDPAKASTPVNNDYAYSTGQDPAISDHLDLGCYVIVNLWEIIKQKGTQFT